MTFDERTAALNFLGYGRRQTQFLALVALHGGFCVRRQYATFAGTACGKNAQGFLDDLVERRLARRVFIEVTRGYLYHLIARPVYRAVGQEDNRNRRATAPPLIARKLMLLDFALAQTADEWCTTEHEKVALCTDRFGIPLERLPRRIYPSANSPEEVTARYFIDKLPFFLVECPPVFHVVFLAAASSPKLFTRFLLDHRAILADLPRWAVVLVAPTCALDQKAFENVFQAFMTAPRLSHRSASIGDLRWYFQTRRAIELDKMPTLSPQIIKRFQSVRQRYAAARFESLYRDWTTRGSAVLDAQRPDVLPPFRAVGRLLVHELPFKYDQFGMLPGVA